jgi:hypothetical protein
MATLPSRSLAGVTPAYTPPTSRPYVPSTTIAPTTTTPSAWQKTNSFLGSPTGQLAVGGLSAGLSAYAQGKANDKSLAAQQAMEEEKLAAARESMLAKLATEQSQNATARAIAGARPIGEAQKFSASMARGNVIADLLGKGPTAPGNPAVAQAANLDNLRIDPNAISRLKSMYSEPATLQSLLSRDQDIAAINPNSAPTNYASLTSLQQESPLTRALMSQFADYRQGAQAQLQDSESYARKLLEQAIDGTSGPVGTGAASAASPFPATAGAKGGGANTATLANTATITDPTTGAVSRAATTPAIDAHIAANGKPEWGASYWEQMTNPSALREGLENGKPHDYYGGPDAPRVDQLTPKMQQAIRQGYGVSVKEDDAKKLLAQGWQYGQPAPKGFEYDEDSGLLKKKGSAWKTLAKVGIIAGAGAATIATGGAASPALYAAIGAGAGAGLAAVDGGGWKQILTGAAVGGITGGAGGAITNAGLNTAKSVAANAAVGAGTGALTGGKRGALLGAAGGAGGAAISPATSRIPNSVAQTAAQAGLTTGLNKSLGGGWTDSLISGGMAASQKAANQQKLKQYQQQQQARSAFDAAGRLVRG